MIFELKKLKLYENFLSYVITTVHKKENRLKCAVRVSFKGYFYHYNMDKESGFTTL